MFMVRAFETIAILQDSCRPKSTLWAQVNIQLAAISGNGVQGSKKTWIRLCVLTQVAHNANKSNMRASLAAATDVPL